MANTTIPQLPFAIALSGIEQFEIVQAGVSRRVSINQIPVFNGTAYGVAEVLATETINAGGFSNIWSGGVRNAIATSPATWASGFAPITILGGTYGTIIFGGLNAAVNIATAGEDWLSDTTPGGFTYTPPSTSGEIIQSLGVAIPGVGIIFSQQIRIEL